VKIIITSLASLLVGVGVGIGAYHLHIHDQAAANAKTRWLICGVHQDALTE
jgi:uncharacterized membrane protein YgdD (TMEM256/DUF423 family)